MSYSIGVRLCPQCDLLMRPRDLKPDQLSRCRRCGVELDRGSNSSRETALAVAAAAGQLWILMNVFPLVALTLSGQRRQTTLGGAAVALATHGMPLLALLVALTAIVAPGLEIGLALYLLGRLETLARSGALGRAIRWFRTARRWSMVDVFMLGCLVSIVKLAHLAELVVGPRGCLAICEIGNHGSTRCPHCGEVVHLRIARSLEKTSAYLAAAAILYVPANVLPVMHSSSVLVQQDDTILSGVVYLFRSGSWPLGVLVFVASVMVPLLKILSLGVLVCMSARRSRVHPLARIRLYRVVDFIGRWSLLDIYAVTMLVALVRMGALASVQPRAGALAFAAVVVLTLLAAQSFDPRAIWDPVDAGDPRP